jgi:hypothetical protein
MYTLRPHHEAQYLLWINVGRLGFPYGGQRRTALGDDRGLWSFGT